MPKTVIKQVFQNSLLLAILLHVLLLLSVSVVLILQPVPLQKLSKVYVPAYVPAYTYTGTIAPSKQDQRPEKKASPKSEVAQATPSSPQAAISQPVAHEKSVLEMSREVLQQDRLRDEMESSKNVEPMLLIGDMSEYADPLIKLLGRSLSANFHYPDAEGQLGIRGTVLVEMTLQPQGRFSYVRIVRSSENANLDAAALYAVNKAPTVLGANRLLSKPKHIVVGFIFN